MSKLTDFISRLQDPTDREEKAKFFGLFLLRDY